MAIKLIIDTRTEQMEHVRNLCASMSSIAKVDLAASEIDLEVQNLEFLPAVGETINLIPFGGTHIFYKVTNIIHEIGRYQSQAPIIKLTAIVTKVVDLGNIYYDIDRDGNGITGK